jgi:hypothetical protein
MALSFGQSGDNIKTLPPSAQQADGDVGKTIGLFAQELISSHSSALDAADSD